MLRESFNNTKPRTVKIDKASIASIKIVPARRDLVLPHDRNPVT